MLSIDDEIKKNQYAKVHLIYGEERYMVRYYKNTLKHHLSKPDDEMNCTIYRGKGTKPEMIMEAAILAPFFAENRLLIVEDSGFFKNANDMADTIGDIPDTTYIVFVESEVDKRNRLYKWVNKYGCVAECVYQQEHVIKRWINGYVKHDHKTISTAAVELLIERVGCDMEMLHNELDKCMGYVGDKSKIEVEDIEYIASGQTVSQIFDMIDAVALGKKDRAMELYNDLYVNKESPMSILHLFSRHINILLQVKECEDRSLSQAEIAGKCKVPPFTVKKYRQQATLFSREKLVSLLKDRIDLEERFKSGNLTDQLAVEMFLIQSLTN